MQRLASCTCSWLFIVAMVWCVLAQASEVAPSITESGRFLQQTESVRRTDYPRFVQMLAQLQRSKSQLSSDELWRLRYLEAWKTMFEGNNSGSRTQLRNIIDHSRNDTLIYEASGLLLSNLGFDQHYVEAFALANQLASELPRIKDNSARFQVLTNLSQMLNLAGQTDLAVKYAQMMEDSLPPSESLCYPLFLVSAALTNAKRLQSSSPELEKTIDTCVTAGQPVVANATWLVQGSLYLEEGKPHQLLKLLDRIEPSLRTNNYALHLLSAKGMRAEAYAMLGEDADARKAALAVVASGGPDAVSEPLKDAYKVLYQIAKKLGNSDAALAYYEKYVTQDKGYLNDVSARALAFQTVQQQVLTKKLETEELNRQNNVLRLQQALDTKAVETGRLYIALLLSLLASIVFWLYRIKRSQLRFKRLSHHDGLTGILNHQHFMNEAARALSLAENKQTDVSLISIDLDHFKQVNDTHGHAMGDEVLQHAVEVCKKHLRTSDIFGRLGGEEFGILLPGCSREQAKDIADCIRKAIGEAAVVRTDVTIWISASVGLACTRSSGYVLQGLCKDADAALYRAKRAGRNRVEVDVKNGDLLHA